MPEPAKKILFICTGNVCRSLMAELLMVRLSQQRGLGLEVRSCGVAAETYFEIPPGARAALAEVGITGIQHEAQLVTRDLLEWADLALTMTRAHCEGLADRFPEFGFKLHPLRGYAGLGETDIQDPLGRPAKAFAQCRDSIAEALEGVARRLQEPSSDL